MEPLLSLEEATKRAEMQINKNSRAIQMFIRGCITDPESFEVYRDVHRYNVYDFVEGTNDGGEKDATKPLIEDIAVLLLKEKLVNVGDIFQLGKPNQMAVLETYEDDGVVRYGIRTYDRNYYEAYIDSLGFLRFVKK